MGRGLASCCPASALQPATSAQCRRSISLPMVIEGCRASGLTDLARAALRRGEIHFLIYAPPAASACQPVLPPKLSRFGTGLIRLTRVLKYSGCECRD